jgi:PhnB protein
MPKFRREFRRKIMEYKPKGWHTITPRIVVKESKLFVNFLKKVFEAVGDYHKERPSEIFIGDSLMMISESGIRQPMNAFLYVYVKNADATHQRAVEAGVVTIEEPFDTPYGDRRCMFEDKWGNTWQVATSTEFNS